MSKAELQRPQPSPKRRPREAKGPNDGGGVFAVKKKEILAHYRSDRPQKSSIKCLSEWIRVWMSVLRGIVVCFLPAGFLFPTDLRGVRKP